MPAIISRQYQPAFTCTAAPVYATVWSKVLARVDKLPAPGDCSASQRATWERAARLVACLGRRNALAVLPPPLREAAGAVTPAELASAPHL